MHQPHRSARLLAFTALAAFAFTLAGAPAAQAAECANTETAPRSENLDEMREAILCLTNAERTQRGLQPLRENARLRKAAAGHSADMVRNRFFAHTGLDGDTLVDRVLAAGYADRRDCWKLGENLAWGTGTLATPAAVHQAWMRSDGHRGIILRAAYRELGIGIRVGVPTDEDAGATFTDNFGVMARASAPRCSGRSDL